MTKLDLSEHLFALAGAVRLLPGTVRRLAEDVVQGACDRASRAIERLGTAVRGCGCTSDDAECCRRAKVTNPAYRDYCLCDCHNVEITTRTLHAEMN